MTEFIKIVSTDQIAEVAALAREIWRQHYIPIVGRQQIEYMLQRFQSVASIREQIRDNHEYYFIDAEKKHAGYLSVVPDMRNSNMKLSKIYVLESFRGVGLGSAALEFISDLCRERGIGQIWLTVNRKNKGSINWYQKKGFENRGPNIESIGSGFVMDDFRMVKAISTPEQLHYTSE